MQYVSVKDYIQRTDDTSREQIFPDTVKLLNLVFLKDHTFSELNLFLKKFTGQKITAAVFAETARLIEEQLLVYESGKIAENVVECLENISYLDLKYILELVKDKKGKMKIYNLNPSYQMESIFYPLKAMVLNGKL